MDSNRCSGKAFVSGLLLSFLFGADLLTANTYRSQFLSGLGIIIVGFWYVFFVFDMLKTGEARWNWRINHRDQNPIGFWIGVILCGAASICMLGLGIVGMLHMVTPVDW